MSGLKYSEIRLEEEREAKLQALDKINDVTVNIKALKEKIKAILGEIPEGVKQSFPRETEKIIAWHKRDMRQASKEWNSTKLNSLVEELNSIYNDGKEAFHLLIEIKETKREKEARKLIERLEGLKTTVDGMSSLLNKWKKGVYEEITRTLEGLYPSIEKGEFINVKNILNSLDEQIAKLRQDITSLESKDKQRNYVLSALRETCKEMGWKELADPELEDKSNPASPLIYKVDTYSAGVNIFYLTLEGIRVDSPIPIKRDTCYKDFDNLSEKLKRFGIKTKFKRQVIDEEPKLIQRGELDLPDEGMDREFEQEV